MTNIRYVFILGAQRSGSTLLNLTLGSHSQTIAIGESWKLNQQIRNGSPCTCGADNIAACPFWSEVCRRMEELIGWNPILEPGARQFHRQDFGKFRSRLLAVAERARRVGLLRLSASKQMAELNIAMFDTCWRVADNKMVVDSGKDPFRVGSIFRLCPEQSRIIYLVRDGRGVASSRLGRGRERSTANYSVMKEATRQWAKENQRTMGVLSELPRHAWIRQRYEDFCESPAGVSEQICEWLGLSYEPEMLDFRNTTHHNLMGNRMRFGSQQSIKVDDAWKENLSQQELAVFEKQAGWLNREFGYDD